MPKLHEILAANTSQSAQSAKCREGVQKTFSDKRNLFSSKITTYTPLLEGAEPETREHSEIQTTVKKEIEWLVNNHLAKAMDIAYAIDVANTEAKANIILEDGKVLAENVPATALLQLEKRLKEMSALIQAIPTLDPAKNFVEDASAGHGIFQARSIKKPSTKKVQKALLMAPATDKHPAQVQLITEDEKVGNILEQEWSSLITPALKSDIFERNEKLLRAVTQARSRANDVEVDVKNNKIGGVTLNYVFSPLLGKTA